MAKSKSSCFKIIACGSDSSEKEDVKGSEVKASLDKRGWSFRKRSSTHRVLSNTATPEVQSADASEASATGHFLPTNPPAQEKISVWQLKEGISQTIPSDELSSNSEQLGALFVAGGARNFESTMQESASIVIQSAIRTYLAKKALYKLKNLVKLQAVIRGHLVRRQAAGTLRCVQAIVKMQALVRARRARLSLAGSCMQGRHDGEINSIQGKANHSEYTAAKTNGSVKKLLANRFARQLYSKPKTKPILVNCDPSRSESSWKWLERWMAVSSSDTMQPQKYDTDPDNGAKTRARAAEEISGSPAMNSNIKGTEVLIKAEENSNANFADEFEFRVYKPPIISEEISSSAMESGLEDECLGLTKEASELGVSQIDNVDSVRILQTKLIPTSDNPDISDVNSSCFMTKFASEQRDHVDKKRFDGSRESTNPSFAAVKLKFEELSSTATSVKSNRFGSRDVSVESRLDSPASSILCASKHKEIRVAENLISHDPRTQMWGSDGGPELSISSTLDSPDGSEGAGGESVNEISSVDIEASDAFNLNNLDAKVDNSSSMQISSSHNPDHVQTEKLQDIHGYSTDFGSTADSRKVHDPSEQRVLDMHAQLGTSLDPYVENLSRSGSPGSHNAGIDSHGTPSTQTSKTSTRDKSDRKYPSKLAGKKSIPNRNHDSTMRNNSEHLISEPKVGKRRTSFDHESRITGSSSLPNYMQVTESARAKAQASSSPKMSPDLHEKDSHVKKRHSLPVSNGKQGSPRMQRASSQSQNHVKGSATHSPGTVVERKWQR